MVILWFSCCELKVFVDMLGCECLWLLSLSYRCFLCRRMNRDVTVFAELRCCEYLSFAF